MAQLIGCRLSTLGAERSIAAYVKDQTRLSHNSSEYFRGNIVVGPYKSLYCQPLTLSR